MCGSWAMMDTEDRTDEVKALYFGGGVLQFSLCVMLSTDVLNCKVVIAKIKSMMSANAASANQQSAPQGNGEPETQHLVHQQIPVQPMQQPPTFPNANVAPAVSATQTPVDPNYGRDVRGWLADGVGLEKAFVDEYGQKLVTHGYDSMSTIRLIDTEQDLIAAGIDKPGHRKKILAAVTILKQEGSD